MTNQDIRTNAKGEVIVPFSKVGVAKARSLFAIMAAVKRGAK